MKTGWRILGFAVAAILVSIAIKAPRAVEYATRRYEPTENTSTSDAWSRLSPEDQAAITRILDGATDGKPGNSYLALQTEPKTTISQLLQERLAESPSTPVPRDDADQLRESFAKWGLVDSTSVGSWRATPRQSFNGVETLELRDLLGNTPVAENGSYFGEISSLTGRPKTVHVRGYYRKDGTYVRSHYRSRPRR